MSREVWRYPVARGAVDPLLEPRLDEVMHTGEIPLAELPPHAPRHARRYTERTAPMLDRTRRVIRTVLAVVLGIALVVPVLLSATGLRGDEWPWLTAVVIASGVVSRVMQTPAVEAFLQRYLGGVLAATPPPAPAESSVNEHVDEHEDPLADAP